MITITKDGANPDKFVVSQTIVMFLDKVMLSSLSDEIEKTIRAQAIKDLRHNPEVKKVIAEAATKKLLAMLGVEEKAVEENSNEHTRTGKATDNGQPVSEDRGAVSQQ
jgi:hypothetical protein